MIVVFQDPEKERARIVANIKAKYEQAEIDRKEALRTKGKKK